MSLQAAIEANLPRLRAEAEARMVDTWEIGEDAGFAYDRTAGRAVQTITPLFTTKARLKATSSVARESEAAGRTVVETRRELHIPASSQAVPVDAIAKCVAVHPTSDPTLLGVAVRLAGPAPGTQQTARRLEVVETLT